MNYDTVSDFEINKAVAEALGVPGMFPSDKPDIILVGKPILPMLSLDDYSETTCRIEAFDPCNNWSDIGPIIEDKKISLCYWASMGWRASNTMRVVADESIGEFEVADKNPRRAAAIVFLKMMEGE